MPRSTPFDLPFRARAAAFLWTSAAAAAVAQPPADPPGQAVVVTATRVERRAFDVPASVDLIDESALHDDRQGLNLSESLATVPGLTARDRENWAQDIQISIRGFGARSSFGIRGVRLLVDGIPATMPDGQGQVSHVDLATTERVEVLRGPFSALFGNSSGGVIEVTTKEGVGAPVFGAETAAGADGQRHQTAWVSGADGRLGYTASLSDATTDGLRPHASGRKTDANTLLTWRPDRDSKLTLVANLFEQPADDPLGLTRAEFNATPYGVDPAALQYDTRKTVDQQQLGARVERHLSDRQTLAAMVYAGVRHVEQFQAIPVGAQANPLHPGGVVQFARDYSGTDLRWTWQAADGDAWSLVTGLASDRLGQDQHGYLNYIGGTLGVQGALRRHDHDTVTDLDPYLQASWHPAPAWRLDAGVRRSQVQVKAQDLRNAGSPATSVHYAATQPVLGLLFAASRTLHLYTAYGRGFETPTLTELAYRPDGNPGLNLALRPSVSDNVEVGAKWQPRRDLGLQMALFQTGTTGDIVTETNTGGRATFQNATRTRRRGLELGVQGRRGPWRAQFAATWLQATYQAAFTECTGTPCATPSLAVPAGRAMPGIAKGSAALSLDWAPGEGWNAGAEARASGRVPVNDAGSDAAPAFLVADLHGGYTARVGAARLRGFARLGNLFGRRYAGSVIVNESNGRYFETAPGRSLWVGIDLTYGE